MSQIWMQFTEDFDDKSLVSSSYNQVSSKEVQKIYEIIWDFSKVDDPLPASRPAGTLTLTPNNSIYEIWWNRFQETYLLNLVTFKLIMI